MNGQSISKTTKRGMHPPPSRRGGRVVETSRKNGPGPGRIGGCLPDVTLQSTPQIGSFQAVQPHSRTPSQNRRLLCSLWSASTELVESSGPMSLPCNQLRRIRTNRQSSVIPFQNPRFLWSLWSGVHFTDFRHADGWPAPRSLLGERQGQVALSRLGGKVAPRRAAATGVQRRPDDHPRSRPYHSDPFRQTISKSRFLCTL